MPLCLLSWNRGACEEPDPPPSEAAPESLARQAGNCTGDIALSCRLMSQ